MNSTASRLMPAPPSHVPTNPSAGEGLLKAKGKLSSADYADDAKMEESFNEDTDYFKRLPVIKMAACKKAIDTKSDLFTSEIA